MFTSFDENEYMKVNFKLLFRNWLLHFILIWIVINVFGIISFINNTIKGLAANSQDGAQITIWKYLENDNYHLSDLLIMALFLFLVEVNYLFLFKRIQWIFFAMSTLSTGIITFIVLALLHPERIAITGSISGVMPVLIMGSYSLVYVFLRDYFYKVRKQKDIKLQQAKNELDALKAQLNPHFLFNSLNYIYGTALNEDAPITADGIDKLSMMMRYTITGIHETFVPLENELNFIKYYLDLQQARLPQKDNIKIAIQVQSVYEVSQIAPLLLLPIIENAFKYGISIDEPCFVNIKITVANNMLTMEVYNSIVKSINKVKGNNTGLKSTIKRLELLYPNRYKLEQSDNSIEYKILIILKLNK